MLAARHQRLVFVVFEPAEHASPGGASLLFHDVSRDPGPPRCVRWSIGHDLGRLTHLGTPLSRALGWLNGHLEADLRLDLLEAHRIGREAGDVASQPGFGAGSIVPEEVHVGCPQADVRVPRRAADRVGDRGLGLRRRILISRSAIERQLEREMLSGGGSPWL
jgi:hypothetical protein